jgi:hypothetical protein
VIPLRRPTRILRFFGRSKSVASLLPILNIGSAVCRQEG